MTTVHIIEIGDWGEDYMECIDRIKADITGDTEDEMIEQAIRLVEERGYTVVRGTDGGCCELTSYSDGSAEIGITVERGRR